MRKRTALVATGVLIMAYAAVGALTDPDVRPGGVLLFLAAVLVGHDAVWMPALLAAGALITRFVRRRHRPAVRAAAISAAAVTLVTLPLVAGLGRSADNPSALPLPYGRNLVIILLVVAGATVLTRPWRTRDGTTAVGRKNSESPEEGGAASPDR
jgi:hypothetical protein